MFGVLLKQSPRRSGCPLWLVLIGALAALAAALAARAT